MSTIRRNFGQLQTLIMNISRADKARDKLKTALSTAISPMLDKEFGELSSTSHRVYAANVYPPKICI